jgi:hypothetical protein
MYVFKYNFLMFICILFMIGETNERSNRKVLCLFKSLRQIVSVTIEFLRSTVENLDNLSVRNIICPQYNAG